MFKVLASTNRFKDLHLNIINKPSDLKIINKAFNLSERGINNHIINKHIKDLPLFFDLLPLYDIQLAQENKMPLTKVVAFLFTLIKSEEQYKELCSKISPRRMVIRPSMDVQGSSGDTMKHKTFRDFQIRAVQCLLLIHELCLDTVVDWNQVCFILEDYKNHSVNVIEEFNKDPFDIKRFPRYILVEKFNFGKSKKNS